MARIKGLRSLFRFPRRSSRQIDREIDDELAFHVDMVTQELTASGVPEHEARERARRQFGDVDRARHALRREEQGIERERRKAELGEELKQDLVFATRQLRRSPAFAIVAVLTLGLGIGATTAIFSAVDGVLLRPLPYPQADRLVRLRQVDARAKKDDAAPANFFDWHERQQSFERLAFFQYYGHDVRASTGETTSIDSWLVSEDYFAALGVQPRLGRVFLPEEFRAGAARVVIISTSLWQQRFGGDPAIIGRREVLDGVAHTIVGVMPLSFQFPDKRYIWAPKIFDSDVEKADRAGGYLGVVGRLRPGKTIAMAQADMSRIARDLAASYPRTNAKTDILLTSVPNELIGDARPALLVLLGAVVCVLLVACANVANLLLARGADRGREFAIRAALGAGRARLARQMITESAILAALGCAVGLLLGRLGISLVLALSPSTLPRADEISLDGRVLAFTLATSLATAFLFGLAPARMFSRPDLHDAVREGGRGTSASRGRLRLRALLIVTEVALALVLLVGSGLLIRSFITLLRVDPGFVPQNRAMVQVFLWDLYPKSELRASFMRDALEHMAAVPGVQSVGGVSAMPFAQANIGIQTPLSIEGRPAAAPGEAPNAYNTVATPGYFETMGIALRRGRTFAVADNDGANRVALVSESLVRRHFPNEDPIGRRIKVRLDGGQSREIVGVVADVRHGGFQDPPREEVYLPHAQYPFGSMTIVVRTAGDPAPLLRAFQRAIWEVNPKQAIYVATTLDAMVSSTLRERRFNLALIGSFATLALLLAAVGVYGLISYSTSRRANEFGVRIALGASGRQILVAAMSDGVRYAVVGVGLGLVASYALTRSLSSMLFGVKATDPLTYAVLAGVMLLVAALASFLPARRALDVDPVTALRGET